MELSIESLREQRLARERKRKDFIRRFEAVKARIGVQESSGKEVPTASRSVPQTSQTEPNQYESLVVENKRLKTRLGEADRATGERMAQMKKEITVLKNSYTTQMQEIIKLSEDQKESQKGKIESLMKQLKDSIGKNNEIQALNNEIQAELDKGESTFDDFAVDLKKQYEGKLLEFSEILQESDGKIEKMEAQLNGDEVVENALKNDQLIQALIGTCQSQVQEPLDSKEAARILEEKTFVIEQLVENSKRKEQEVVKIKELSETYKAVFQNLNTQKEMLLKDNQDMTKQLLEIRKIFAGILGQKDAQDQEEDDQQAEEEVDDEEGEEEGEGEQETDTQ